MEVLRADVLGMCFGVRDALAVLEQIERPDAVTIHGELVHNEKVLARLELRGFHQAGEANRNSAPPTDTVLITAHGISHKERQRLTAAGKTLIDTTCPLVTRAHQAAQKLQAEGRHVLIVGKREHVEVRGIVEDLASFEVVQAPEDVRQYPHAKLGLMCQTTTPTRLAEAVRRRVFALNPHADIRVADTICHPTKDHQQALEDLLDRVEAVVVVGGSNSNNTRQLVLRCQERGIPAYHVQDAAGLRSEWFTDLERVGVTAGTSTLEETIAEVQQALLDMASTHLTLVNA